MLTEGPRHRISPSWWMICLALLSCSDPENDPAADASSSRFSLEAEAETGSASEPDGLNVTTFAPEPADPALASALQEPSVIAKDESKPFHPAVRRMKDSEAAMALELLELPESDARELALTELMRQWSQYDLEAALKFGWEHTKGDIQAKRAFHKGVMPQLARTDPHAALDVIEAGHWWPDQWKDQREALRRIEGENFERAAEFFQNTGEGKQHKEEAYRYTDRIGREQGHAAAISYAEGLKKQIAKAYATRAAITRWVNDDSVGASNYVNGIQNPEIRDYAAVGLIDGIWETNPEESVSWAGSIKNEDLRETTFYQLGRRWSDDRFSSNLRLLPPAYRNP